MASFPRTEAKVTELARDVIAGLDTLRDHFPTPPVPHHALQAALDAFHEADAAAVDAAATASRRYAEKKTAFSNLVALLKTDLRYAENTVGFDGAILSGLGWGGRKPKTRLEPPGQVLGLGIVREGEGWIALRWDKPVDGGKAQAYRVQVRAGRQASWREAGSTVMTEITLNDQQRGVDLEYRVIAINRAGEGPASAVAFAVL